MKAVVYDAPGQFELRDIPQPVPQAGQVLLKVLIAGICGTDLHLHHGEFGPSYPLIPGHEIVGEVIAHGSGVTAPGIGQRHDRQHHILRCMYRVPACPSRLLHHARRSGRERSRRFR